MILDKQDLPNDPTPADAPPSYEDLAGTSSGGAHPRAGSGAGRLGGRFWRTRDEKASLGDTGSTSISQSQAQAGGSGRFYPFASSSSAAQSPLATAPRPSKLSKSKTKSSGGGLSWFASFTSSHREFETQRDVRATVLGLIHNLAQNAPSSHPQVHAREGAAVAAEGILNSCVAACNSCGISLSEILQERSVEGHTPLYWAIVKRPRNHRSSTGTNGDSDSDDDGALSSSGNDADALLRLLLLHTAPLNASTVSELRLACLVAADNTLLQRLRADPAVVPRSGTEAMLNGSAASPRDDGERPRYQMDMVHVYEDNGEEGDKCGAFIVKIEIRRFQKRMRVAGGVSVEFVARGEHPVKIRMNRNR